MTVQCPRATGVSLTTLFFGLLVCLLHVGSGCEQPTNTGYVETHGLVLFEGEPLAKARVVFVPARAKSDLGWELPFSVGFTDAQGRFLLTTEMGSPGAVAGWHDVWIVEPNKESKQTSSEVGRTKEEEEARNVVLGTEKPLRYSRHRIEIKSPSTSDAPLEIDHGSGLRLRTEFDPPSWVLNQAEHFDRSLESELRDSERLPATNASTAEDIL